MNDPEPMQPVAPVAGVSIHVPVIEFHVVSPEEFVVPVAVPVKASVLLPDCTDI